MNRLIYLMKAQEKKFHVMNLKYLKTQFLCMICKKIITLLKCKKKDIQDF